MAIQKIHYHGFGEKTGALVAMCQSVITKTCLLLNGLTKIPPCTKTKILPGDSKPTALNQHKG